MADIKSIFTKMQAWKDYFLSQGYDEKTSDIENIDHRIATMFEKARRWEEHQKTEDKNG